MVARRFAARLLRGHDPTWSLTGQPSPQVHLIAERPDDPASSMPASQSRNRTRSIVPNDRIDGLGRNERFPG